MANLGMTIEREFYYGAGRGIMKRARFLRNAMTPSENILWQHLRKKRLSGILFRRQHPISNFIVDFYCHEARLVIEIDGDIHNQQENKEYDENRTFELEKFGLKVIRFSNDDINNNITKVLEILEGEIRDRMLLDPK